MNRKNKTNKKVFTRYAVVVLPLSIITICGPLYGHEKSQEKMSAVHAREIKAERVSQRKLADTYVYLAQKSDYKEKLLSYNMEVAEKQAQVAKQVQTAKQAQAAKQVQAVKLAQTAKHAQTTTQAANQVQAEENSVPLESSQTTNATNTVTSSATQATQKVIIPNTGKAIVSGASASAVTQYSHTENGHYEGQYYNINASQPTIVKTSGGTTVSGTISRLNSIGLEKGSIVLNYNLNFDGNGNYVSGEVNSSGYVSASINLASGQNYTGQTTNFISTSGGHAGSGSYIYPIIATMSLR
ncbi:hypothetical protein [Pseudolactococcus insecticola]|uniref:hypothetical protein n=1 Tax=Pseudolactococcus insecticola TaxID=2709158 RepID=UPI001554A290|nr:hypothetical protein [Lactococcus insecticola]